MDPTTDDVGLPEVLVQMGSLLLTEETVDRVLQLVTELTERTVHSASAVSVTLNEAGNGARTSNASDEVARRLDEVQYGSGVGPCLEALGTGLLVNARLADDGDRWPAFTAAARDAGIGSILSLPLRVKDTPLGALNVYSQSPERFDDVEETTASLLAQQASAVLANVVALESATNLNRQLREALASRDLIGQAKGILMERQGCDSEVAFDVLRRASQRTNRKLHDVANDLAASVAKADAQR